MRPLLHILREEGEHLLRISSEVVVELVNRMACPSCEVTVLDMQDTRIANRAKELGISTVPAVVIDGRVAECCKNRGVDEAALRVAGVGVAA